MKSNILRIAGLTIIFSLCSISFSLGQSKITVQHVNSKMGKDSSKIIKMDMKGMKMGVKSSKKMEDTSKAKYEEPKLYKGIINLKQIDLNKDGKVYQCPMDFNVLSDKPGIDPKCGMKLKEVTIKEARENLINHGFHIK